MGWLICCLTGEQIDHFMESSAPLRRDRSSDETRSNGNPGSNSHRRRSELPTALSDAPHEMTFHHVGCEPQFLPTQNPNAQVRFS